MLSIQVVKIRMCMCVCVACNCLKVLAVAHRGCSEVDAERTLVLKESSSKRSLRSPASNMGSKRMSKSPTLGMASKRTSKSPTSSTASPPQDTWPSDSESDSDSEAASCVQSLVIDVCVRGPWERGAPNQVHNSDLKGLTCEMLCQQLTVL